ncbi:MAG: hypothetical protein R2854_04465 [Caldilineaceae bacterium]
MAEQAATIEQQLRRNAALYFPHALGKVAPKHVAKEASAYARAAVARGTPLRAKFVIMTRRAGKGLLVDLLNSHPQIQGQTELLHDRMLFPRRYLRANERLARLPVFGFKLLSYQMIGAETRQPCRSCTSLPATATARSTSGGAICCARFVAALRRGATLVPQPRRRRCRPHDHACGPGDRAELASMPSTRLGEWERSVLAGLPYVDDLRGRSQPQRVSRRRYAHHHAAGTGAGACAVHAHAEHRASADDFVANADESCRSSGRYTVRPVSGRRTPADCASSRRRPTRARPAHMRGWLDPLTISTHPKLGSLLLPQPPHRRRAIWCARPGGGAANTL